MLAPVPAVVTTSTPVAPVLVGRPPEVSAWSLTIVGFDAVVLLARLFADGIERRDPKRPGETLDHTVDRVVDGAPP